MYTHVLLEPDRGRHRDLLIFLYLKITSFSQDMSGRRDAREAKPHDAGNYRVSSDASQLLASM